MIFRLKNQLLKFLTQSMRKLPSWAIMKFRNQNLLHYKDAYVQLVARYRATWEFWWARRDQIKSPDLKSHEAEFLPGALALLAAPVSPLGRWVSRVLIGMLVISLLWSVIGKFDIVVNGNGKIIASGNTKTVASLETAKVLMLNVEEGQIVKAGDLLIELDTRGYDSERDKAEGDRQLALLQMERAKALLGAINNSLEKETEASKNHKFKEPKLEPIEGVDDLHYQNEVLHLADQWHDFMTKRERISSQIARYNKALPLIQSRADDYAILFKTGDVSGHAYIEKEQARIDLQGQLVDAKKQLAGLIAETRKTAQDDLYQATRILSASKQDFKKAEAHSDQLKITAPVDGVVQQLTVHTVGGVVPAAQPLMLIVPSSHTIELAAYVENKDIGFIREGQSAQVKIDAFEYTKYGTISAKVIHVSRDAIDLASAPNPSYSANSTSGATGIADKGSAPKGGLMYAVKILLEKPYMTIDGKEVPLAPGMTASVEIKTGSRRVIEYVLSPLITHTKESLRER
jgi:hemolysin D